MQNLASPVQKKHPATPRKRVADAKPPQTLAMPRFYVTTNGKRKRKSHEGTVSSSSQYARTSAPFPGSTRLADRFLQKRKRAAFVRRGDNFSCCWPRSGTDKASRESLLTEGMRLYVRVRKEKLLLGDRFLGFVVLLATVICEVMLARVQSERHRDTHVGYTSAGLAGRRESWPGSSGTCGCHHRTRAWAAALHQRAARDIAGADSRWEAVERGACQGKT